MPSPVIGSMKPEASPTSSNPAQPGSGVSTASGPSTIGVVASRARRNRGPSTGSPCRRDISIAPGSRHAP